MHRSLAAAIFAASLACALPIATIAGPPNALTQARARLDRNDPQGAAELLADALPTTAATDRAPLLELLRRAYEFAARQAEAAGKAADAEHYRENLAILDRKPRTAPAAAPLTTLPKITNPAPVKLDGNVSRATTTPEPPTSATAPDPSPAASATKPDGTGQKPAAAPAEASAPSTTADVSEQIRLANKAFRAQSYDEAGRIYGALWRENRLPKAYFNHLAYCRCVEIKQRINAKPTTAEEWAQIDAELDKIAELSPKFWLIDYLRNAAAERSKGQSRTRSNKVVVRGAAPEEPAPARVAPYGPTNDGRRAAPAEPGAVARDAAAAGVELQAPAPAPAGRWQVHETPSFRIFHADAELAQRVAEVAERTRDVQIRRWSGAEPREPWAPKCDIYLYPTAKVFSAMTGQPEESPGFSTMGMDAGRINCRRVNLRGDHPKITAAILPHEVTHVVLADFFPRKQIPRWADEGMAVLAEPRAEQLSRAADLDAPLASGRLFHMGDLMVMDYPNAEHWGLYYAQSVSLTRFLVEKGTPAQFIEFVQGCQQRSHEDELRRIYKIDSFAELERRWLEFARTQTATARATADTTTKDADTVNR